MVNGCFNVGPSMRFRDESVAAAALIIDRLNAGTMPTGGKTISDSDKAILIKFLTP